MSLSKTYTHYCEMCGHKETESMQIEAAIEKLGKRCKKCGKGYLRVLPTKTDIEKP